MEEQALSGPVSYTHLKFLQPATMEALLQKAGAGKGSLVLIVADADRETALNALGMLRCEVARRMDVIPEGVYKLLWVTDFPLFEYGEDDEGNRRLYAKHHPFTAPKDEDLPLFETNPIAKMCIRDSLLGASPERTSQRPVPCLCSQGCIH